MIHRLPRRHGALLVFAMLLVAGCVYGRSSGPEADPERQAALIAALESAQPESRIDLAETLDAHGAGLLSMWFESKGQAYLAVGAGLKTDAEDIWPGPGSGSVVMLSRGSMFLAWFGIPDSVAMVCPTSEIQIDDHVFRVIADTEGRRRFVADGIACDPPSDSGAQGTS